MLLVMNLSLDEHTAVPDVLLISTGVWKGLSPQEQKWLQEAVDDSVPYQRSLWQEASDEALREVEKAGVDIIYPDKGPFQVAVGQVHESYRGTTIYDLIEDIAEIK